MYLLARCIMRKMSVKASGADKLSISVRALGKVLSHKEMSSLSKSVYVFGEGILPPKYCVIIAVVRLTRLPRSLTKSAFVRTSNASLV